MINNNRQKKMEQLSKLYVYVYYMYMCGCVKERAVTYVLYKTLGQKHKSMQWHEVISASKSHMHFCVTTGAAYLNLIIIRREQRDTASSASFRISHPPHVLI